MPQSIANNRDAVSQHSHCKRIEPKRGANQSGIVARTLPAVWNTAFKDIPLSRSSCQLMKIFIVTVGIAIGRSRLCTLDLSSNPHSTEVSIGYFATKRTSTGNSSGVFGGCTCNQFSAVDYTPTKRCDSIVNRGIQGIYARSFNIFFMTLKGLKNKWSMFRESRQGPPPPDQDALL